MVKSSYEKVIRLEPFNPTRITDKEESEDRLGPFAKSLAYEGWTRSIFPVAWFDSEPERRVANMVDGDGVSCWVRLHVNDMPILWNSFGQQYNPDLIVIDTDGTHWVVEVKMDKEMISEDVQRKRKAAKRLGESRLRGRSGGRGLALFPGVRGRHHHREGIVERAQGIGDMTYRAPITLRTNYQSWRECALTLKASGLAHRSNTTT
jgi:hypothetical protein